jgi:hypothetical protein
MIITEEQSRKRLENQVLRIHGLADGLAMEGLSDEAEIVLGALQTLKVQVTKRDIAAAELAEVMEAVGKDAVDAAVKTLREKKAAEAKKAEAENLKAAVAAANADEAQAPVASEKAA